VGVGEFVEGRSGTWEALMLLSLNEREYLEHKCDEHKDLEMSIRVAELVVVAMK
jgi:hypothetical protein